MPRPTRVQYPDAFYHVMNRGRGRQTIFHDEAYFRAFLDTLAESHERFDAIIHTYCLMTNHYHLLVQTPRANLDRIMRHINGIYTQRYNRLRKTDGPLFRGRYKAILVDADAYLLQLSRYIHRNPIEVKGAHPDSLLQYPWSSYFAYINIVKPEPWLARDKIYAMMGHKQRYVGYRTYVEAGVDEDIKRFYNKGNVLGILGTREFRDHILENREEYEINGKLSKLVSERVDTKAVVAAVSKVFNVRRESIKEPVSGRRHANVPRKLAIYCCQHDADLSLKEIADYFGYSNTGSVSGAVHSVKRAISAKEFVKEVRKV